MKKEKNALNVAVKASKQELSEQNKRHDAKIGEFEKKIVELTEFRKKRLSEDRVLRIKQKKDLKKASKTSPLSNSPPVTCLSCNNDNITPKNNNTTSINSMTPTLITSLVDTKA